MNTPGAPIRTLQGRFVDLDGRQVILHGINLVNKNPSAGYLGPETAETFAAFRRWGFNCIRLGVIWDGLEPEPGRYNEAYLEGIDRQLTWAHANGLYVFLDMHQDLYSVLYSDGAPAWATLHEGQPHLGEGEVWSDAYFTSGAVQTALDNFWRNALAPDGVGLQDHLSDCWRMLAERYGDHPAVIGYDLLNEPVPGAASPQAMAMLFARGAELLSRMGIGPIPHEGDADSGGADAVEHLTTQWMTVDGRVRLLQALDNSEAYAALVDAAQPVYNHFEREALMPFYRRVGAAIREVDLHGIIFLETSMGSNMGVRSAVEPLAIGGERDPQQAYAPHGYDLVVDTADVAGSSSARVGVIFRRHGETAQGQGWPMLVGEWGAYGFWADTLPAARDVVGLFEELLCSDTYWAYEQGIEEADCFRAIHRPYPQRVAGRLEGYHYAAAAKTFSCTWLEKSAITASTIVYIPDWLSLAGRDVVLEPAGDWTIESIEPGGTWLHVPSVVSGQRTLSIA